MKCDTSVEKVDLNTHLNFSYATNARIKPPVNQHSCIRGKKQNADTSAGSVQVTLIIKIFTDQLNN